MRGRDVKRGLALAAGILALCLSVAACGSSSDSSSGSSSSGSSGSSGKSKQASGSLGDMQQSGTAEVAIVANPPYSSISASGQIGGFAPEVVSAIFKKIGISKLSGHPATYDNAIPGLLANRWQMIASDLDVTPERCAAVEFGNSLGGGGDKFVVKPGNPMGLHTLKDIVRTHARLGNLTGAAQLPYLKNTVHIPSSQIVVLPDDASELADLRAGRIDAVMGADLALATSPVWKPVMKKHEFELTGVIPDWPVSVASVVFKKGDDDLRNAFNKGLSEIVQSGEFAAIGKKNGFPPSSLRGAGASAPVAKACKSTAP